MKGERKIVGVPKKILVELVLLLLLTVILPSMTVVSASSTIWTTVYLSPSSVVGPPPSIGETFTLDINVDNVTDLVGWLIGLSWSPSILNCTAFTYNNSWFPGLVPVDGTINNTIGEINPPYAYAKLAPGVNGSGTIAHATFLAKDFGTSWINISYASLANSTAGIPVNLLNSSFSLVLHGPTAVKTHTPLTPGIYETTTFNASASEPGFNGVAEVPITNYTWDFGDSNITTVTDPIIYHMYRATGNYTVTLNVTCQDPILIAKGIASDTASQNITVIMPPYPVTIKVPRDFPTIQAAIDAARDNDTVWVASGTYYENLVVNKAVTLEGENNNDTIIDGNANWHVVTVTSDNVTISGFTIQKGIVSPLWGFHGILMQNVNGCVVRYNRIVQNFMGIELTYGSRNTIDCNSVIDNQYGIELDYSDNNTITSNDVRSNGLYGIYLFSSNGNTMHHNNLIDNQIQAYDDTANAWDDGSEGNYWSDYAGQDLDHNGIGDTPYVINGDSQDNYPLMKAWGYDVAIINIIVSRNIGFFGYPTYIDVVLENQGNYTTETTELTIYYGDDVIKEQTVQLPARTRVTYHCAWIPTGPYREQHITATLQAIIGEFDIADNSYVDGEAVVTIPGDADGNGICDLWDLLILAHGWFSTTDLRADFDGSGRTDLWDLLILAQYWMQTA